jgi:hypothetical protein
MDATRGVRRQGHEGHGQERIAGAPAKHVARLTNENHHTVEAWRAGCSRPSLPAFFNLVRQVPGCRMEVQRVLKLSETDEEFQRALNDLIRAAQRVRL